MPNYANYIPTIPVKVTVGVDYLSLALLAIGLFLALLFALFAYSRM